MIVNLYCKVCCCSFCRYFVVVCVFFFVIKKFVVDSNVFHYVYNYVCSLKNQRKINKRNVKFPKLSRLRNVIIFPLDERKCELRNQQWWQSSWAISKSINVRHTQKKLCIWTINRIVCLWNLEALRMSSPVPNWPNAFELINWMEPFGSNAAEWDSNCQLPFESSNCFCFFFFPMENMKILSHFGIS